MKRNHKIAKAMRSGIPPYTRARRAGDPKRPCAHCQQITRDIKHRSGAAERALPALDGRDR